jgi:predicted enzyme related to lactoylglutathione lyase
VINGVHAIVFSSEAELLRAFFRDVLGLTWADAGGGWPVFALPPAELAVHPADADSGGRGAGRFNTDLYSGTSSSAARGRAADGRHELYLMCDDIHATLAELAGKGAEIASEVSDQGWGLLAAIRLPDGTELPIYEPRHPSPPRP